MAQLIVPAATPPAGYIGLRAIFQYTNWDGRWTPVNCGQAAACTFLTRVGKLEPIEGRAGTIMQRIERAHPPDILGGYLGTSRRRIERICRSHGIPLIPICGERSLRRSIADGKPVIVMLGVAGPRFLRWNLPTGHWMVAYGYDAQHVYLTNWGRMSWADFRRGWKGLVPLIINMRLRGLVGR